MPDISITIVNSSQDDQTIAIFATAEAQTLSTAWAVFKLGGTGGQAQIPFPVDYQVAAGPEWNEGPAEIANIMAADPGSAWTYSVQDGYPELVKTGDTQPEQITITNESGSAAWVGLAKMNIPYQVVNGVQNSMTATFQPGDSIVIGVVTTIAGSVVDVVQIGPVATVDLAGANAVDATLVKQDGSLAWQVTINGEPVAG